MKDEVKIQLKVNTTYDYVISEMQRIQAETNMEQVVLQGITDIQKAQRKYAPRGKTGQIPMSIRPGRVVRRGDSVTGTSETNRPEAIFTNEGTGRFANPPRIKKGAPEGKAYFIPIGSRGFWHPGIKGTHWWEKGAEVGGTLAFRSFRHKIERILRIRG